MAWTKNKTSFAVLTLILILAGTVILVWVLADSAPQVPLTARVIYRTNDPSGQMCYLIAVTNVSNDRLFVQPDRKGFTNCTRRTTPSFSLSPGAGFDLDPQKVRLFFAATRPDALEQPALW